MNLFTFLTVCCGLVVSLVLSSEILSRENVAKKTHEVITHVNTEEEKKIVKGKKVVVNPRANPRGGSFEEAVTTTTTTKSPLQILEDQEEDEKYRNPKGILTGSRSKLQKEIEKFKKKLKDSQRKCLTNLQCKKRNKNSCCMLEPGPGYCMKLPGHYQRCSDECPCGKGFECKVNIQINDRGDATYQKQCLKISEPESPDIKKIEAAGLAKKRGSSSKRDEDDSLTMSRLPAGARRWKFK